MASAVHPLIAYVVERNVRADERDKREKRDTAAWSGDMATRLSEAVDKLRQDDKRRAEMHQATADAARYAEGAAKEAGDAKQAQKFADMARRYEALAAGEDAPTQRCPVRRRGEAGFARLEPLYLIAGGAVGFAAAPRLNAKITVRPLGRHVPPSAVASVAVLLGAGLARRYGLRNTAVASFGLGLGLGLGTLASARNDGGLLAGKGL